MTNVIICLFAYAIRHNLKFPVLTSSKIKNTNALEYRKNENFLSNCACSSTRRVSTEAAMSKWLVIGICGITCGGKTTLATELNKLLPHSRIVSQDDYFLDVDDPKHIWVEELSHINFEVLSSLDMERMHKDIVNIIQNSNVEFENVGKELSFFPLTKSLENLKNELCHKIELKGLNILIVEGFSIFNYKPVEALCDLKYYLTLSKHECALRRSKRVYEPPDCPGYFDKVVWPEYVKLLADVKKNVQNVRYFNEHTPDILKKVLVDILNAF